MIVSDPPEEFKNLSDEQQSILKEWIATHYIPAKTIWEGHTSYGEKHRFENDYERGFYITNGQFKGAMQSMGYEPAYRGEQNWEFKIRLSKVGKDERKLRHSAE